MSKLTLHVEGYGEVVVKIPKKLTRNKVNNAIGSAVAQTMQLASPRKQAARFHPVLGFGGHVD
jgi:hypothetical protein